MSEHFFSRWSQRKQAVAKGLPVAEVPAPSPSSESSGLPGASDSAQRPRTADAIGEKSSVAPTDSRAEVPAEPLPSLDDARALTPSSDFQPFMRPGVAADVRNVAMKKLFTDPHFNVMDGLDIYIGDYNLPDPLPEGMLQKMVGAQLLNLFPKEGPDPHPASSQPSNPESNPAALDPTAPHDPPVVAQSPPSQSALALPATEPLEHDHPDLQLQPNHAPASPSAGPSTG
jgi:hypothetical protein